MSVSPVLLQEGGRWNRRIYGSHGSDRLAYAATNNKTLSPTRWEVSTGTWIVFWSSHMYCGMCLAALTRTCMYTHWSVHVHAHTHGGGRWKNKTNQEALHILHTLGVAQEVSKTLIFSKNRWDLYKQASRGGMVGRLSFGKVRDGLREWCSVKLSFVLRVICAVPRGMDGCLSL